MESLRKTASDMEQQWKDEQAKLERSYKQQFELATKDAEAELSKSKQQVKNLEKALAAAQSKKAADAQANDSIGPATLALTAGASSSTSAGAAVGAVMTTEVLDRFLKTENELTVERGERRRLELYLSQVIPSSPRTHSLTP